MRRVILGAFAAVVLAVLFIVLCTFVRRPYETVLLYRFGNLVEDKDQARIAYNWYFKLPTDSVVRIDKRLHLYTGSLQQVATKGREAISIRTFAAWRIVDPMKFYKTTAGGSDERAKEIMNQKIQGLVQAKLSDHTIDELFNTDESKVHIKEIEDQVREEATKGSPDLESPGKRSVGLADQGLELVEVGFSRMAFPPNNANSVYLRMVEELKKEAIRYDAEGKRDASIRRAQGDQDAARLRAEALAQAEKIKGDGDREALEIIAKVQTTPAIRDFYQFWKNLDFGKSAFAANTVLVLKTSDAPWIQPLFQKPQNGIFSPPAAQTQPVSPTGVMTIPGSILDVK